MMSTRKKRMVLAGGILWLVGPMTWLWLGNRSGVHYRTATVDRGDINVTVSATGNPNAVVTVQVGSQVSGNILALFADFNTKVSKGELIARIDPAPFQTKVNQAQANLDAARASVANSQAVVQQALREHSGRDLVARRRAGQRREGGGASSRTPRSRSIGASIMVEQGADAKEDLETAQTTYKSAVADHDALVAQQHAVEDSVKVAQAQLNVAQLAGGREPGAGEAVHGGAAVGADRPRSHEHHGAGGRRRGVAQRGRRTDGRRQPGCADAVPDRAGPDEDAGGHQRVGSGRGPRSREPAGDVHGGRVSRARRSRAA